MTRPVRSSNDGEEVAIALPRGRARLTELAQRWNCRQVVSFAASVGMLRHLARLLTVRDCKHSDCILAERERPDSHRRREGRAATSYPA